MKKVLLFILSLSIAVPMASQIKLDSININRAQEIILNKFDTIPTQDYFVAVFQDYFLITYSDSNKYFLSYYKNIFDINMQKTIFDLIETREVKIKKHSVLYKLFNEENICSVSQLYTAENLNTVAVHGNPFFYFVIYRKGEKLCEFNYSIIETGTANNIPLKKEYFTYVFGNLLKVSNSYKLSN
jgi:hypothetical protein